MANTNMFSLGAAFSKPKTEPVMNWEGFGKFFYPGARQYRDFVKNEQGDLYDQFKTDYLGNRDEAMANARVYQDYARNLFQNQPNPFDSYQQVGDYLYGKLGDFSQSLQGAGLRDMNSRLAGLGIRPGSTGYDRLLNATRITNNLVPAFNTVTNTIGRDYGTLANNSFRDTALRLGLADSDALNQYTDNVFARPLNVADARMGQLSGNNQLYNQLVNNFKSNVAGFETKETSDWAKGIGVVDNLLNGVVDLYMSYLGGGGTGGIGGMFGGMAGGQQQPQSNNPYSSYLGAASQMIANQNINPYSFNAPQNNPYLGDVNVGAMVPYTG